jgi:hypothetical protein
MSESKFEEDPQFLEDEYVKKGSNQEIKNVAQSNQKYSQNNSNATTMTTRQQTTTRNCTDDRRQKSKIKELYLQEER